MEEPEVVADERPVAEQSSLPAAEPAVTAASLMPTAMDWDEVYRRLRGRRNRYRGFLRLMWWFVASISLLVGTVTTGFLIWMHWFPTPWAYVAGVASFVLTLTFYWTVERSLYYQQLEQATLGWFKSFMAEASKLELDRIKALKAAARQARIDERQARIERLHDQVEELLRTYRLTENDSERASAARQLVTIARQYRERPNYWRPIENLQAADDQDGLIDDLCDAQDDQDDVEAIVEAAAFHYRLVRQAYARATNPDATEAERVRALRDMRRFLKRIPPHLQGKSRRTRDIRYPVSQKVREAAAAACDILQDGRVDECLSYMQSAIVALLVRQAQACHSCGNFDRGRHHLLEAIQELNSWPNQSEAADEIGTAREQIIEAALDNPLMPPEEIPDTGVISEEVANHMVTWAAVDLGKALAQGAEPTNPRQVATAWRLIHSRAKLRRGLDPTTSRLFLAYEADRLRRLLDRGDLDQPTFPLPPAWLAAEPSAEGASSTTD